MASTRVQPGLSRDTERRHQPGGQQPGDPAANRQAARAAHRCQHHTLGQQLPDDGAAAAAKCDARRDLGPARDASSDEKAGDVHAANQQHDADRAPENQQRPARVVGETALQRYGAEAHERIVTTPSIALARQLRRRGRDLIGGLRPADAVLQPRDEPVVLPGAFSRR
jgi:hypothetical protein